jgi:hypothetical protein
MPNIKPYTPMEVDPENFMKLIKSFMKSYPMLYVELESIATEAKRDLAKLDLKEDNLNFSKNIANFLDISAFWHKYLEIEDIEFSNRIIDYDVFRNIKPTNSNAIFKATGVQNLSYSLVLSKVGIKIELLIKTLRKDIKNKKAFNKKIFDELSKNKKLLNSKIKNLVWERLDDRVYSRVYFVIAKRSVNNKVNLPRLTIDEAYFGNKNHIFSKMAHSTNKFYKVFNPVIKKLNIKSIEKKL